MATAPGVTVTPLMFFASFPSTRAAWSVFLISGGGAVAVCVPVVVVFVPPLDGCPDPPPWCLRSISARSAFLSASTQFVYSASEPESVSSAFSRTAAL